MIKNKQYLNMAPLIMILKPFTSQAIHIQSIQLHIINIIYVDLEGHTLKHGFIKMINLKLKFIYIYIKL